MKEEFKDSFIGAASLVNTTNVGVYKLTHLKTGKFYIGSTGNFYYRRVHHISDLRKGTHPVKELQNLYNEDPHFKYEFFLVGHGPDDRQLAYAHEQEMLIDNANNPNLLNLTLSVVGQVDIAELEKRFAPDTLAWKRIRAIRETLSANQTQLRNLPEAVARTSKSTTAQWQDPVQRAKLLAKRQSDEGREANVKWNKEKWADPEYRKMQMEQRTSPEAREKIRLAKIASGQTRRVMVNGVRYPSLMDASRALGIGRSALARKLKSNKAKNKEYVYLD